MSEIEYSVQKRIEGIAERAIATASEYKARVERAERECDEWKVKEERARAARNRSERRNQRLSGELAAVLSKFLRLEKLDGSDSS